MTELDFVADSWFEIRGRGWVAAISGDPLPEGMNPGDLLHRYVRIDGHEYFVTGVERAGYVRSYFGLLVRGPKIIDTVKVEE